jgi:hypothetical protein
MKPREKPADGGDTGPPVPGGDLGPRPESRREVRVQQIGAVVACMQACALLRIPILLSLTRLPQSRIAERPSVDHP